MVNIKDERNISYFIAVSFLLGALIPMISIIIFAPDFSKEYPVYPPQWIMLTELGEALLIGGLTVMGIKLADDKKIMPSAGFTMLAISYGLMSVSLFEIIQVASLESYIKQYYIAASSNFLYIPGMFLISTYRDFKKWVRYIGMIAAGPLLITSFIFISGYRDFHVMEDISNVGYILIFLTHISWGISVYLNYRKKVAALVKEDEPSSAETEPADEQLAEAGA